MTTSAARSNILLFPPVRSTKGEIAAEARRRIERTGYTRFLLRQKLTGVPVPADVIYGKSQIEFAAEALGKLDHLPENFRDDHFWPL